MKFSNMTVVEEFNLNGTLSQETIEQNIDLLESIHQLQDSVDDVDSKIHDAKCQFPEEDFLNEIINRIGTLAKKLRGDNKDEAMAIAECLEDIAQCTFNAADYGRSELQDAQNIIEEIKAVL